MTIKNTSPWMDTVADERRFPILDASLTADVIVAGGGIAGVLTAWNLAGKGHDVVLLERNHIATGDTGFTTAFLTRMPDTSVAALERRHGTDFLRRLFHATTSAQRAVRQLVSHEQIACDYADCASYFGAYAARDEWLRSEWDAIREADSNARLLTDAHAVGAGAPFVEAVRFGDEARFDVRLFLFGLLARPATRRIRIFEETDAAEVEIGSAVTVKTTAGGSIRARALVVATGVPVAPFAELAALVTPKVTFALAASYQAGVPISDNLFWDTDTPYQYFRRLDSHTVILGGADRSATATDRTAKDPHVVLEAFLNNRLGGAGTVTHTWSGSLFETEDGLPYIAQHPEYPGRVFVATGFGGNGMVMGMLAGQILGDLATGVSNIHAPLFDFSRTTERVAAGAAQGGHDARPGPGTTVPRPAGEAGFRRVATRSSLRPGTPLCAESGQRKLALFEVQGKVFALDNVCTHAGGPLCEGPLEGTVIVCPWHLSKFDVTTGAVLKGPARKPQPTFTARVVDDAIEVKAER